MDLPGVGERVDQEWTLLRLHLDESVRRVYEQVDADARFRYRRQVVAEPVHE